MASEVAITITKMLETLPEQAQDRVVEHLREYIEDLRDEVLWNESFSRTQANLVSAARQVHKEIKQGKATPLDIEKL
jgi:DNA phosphorothioation-dependent restriction protein DptG